MFVYFLSVRRPPRSTRTETLFPSTTLFRSQGRPGRRSPRRARHRPLDFKLYVVLTRTRENLSWGRRFRGVLTMAEIDQTLASVERAILPTIASMLDALIDSAQGARPGIDGLRYATDIRLLAEPTDRPEERQVGKECVSTCRSGGAPVH